MDVNAISAVYEQNKMAGGKKIKYFRDANEIKKHKYGKRMSSEETILFGIKKNLELHIMTDKAFYCACSVENTMLTTSKRIALDKITDWRVDGGVLYINTRKIDMGVPVGKQEKACMNAISNIFAALLQKAPEQQLQARERKPVDAQTVWQVYQAHRSFQGNKFVEFTDGNEIRQGKLVKLLPRIAPGEQIFAMLDLLFKIHIFTDKAFYYITEQDVHKRVAYEQLSDCRGDISSGKLRLGNDVIECKTTDANRVVTLIWAIEGMLCALIDHTTVTPPYPQYSGVVETDVFGLSVGFTAGMSAQDVTSAALRCEHAYRDTRGIVAEVPVSVDQNIFQEKKATRSLPMLYGKPLVFNYEMDKSGFFASEQYFGIYSYGRQNANILRLQDVQRISLRNVLGKLYLTLNENPQLTAEIMRPCANSCVLMMLSFCLHSGAISWPQMIELAAHLRRIRALTDNGGVRTSADTARHSLDTIAKGFECVLSPDEAVALWSSGNQMVSINEHEIHLYRLRLESQIETQTKPLSDGQVSLGFATQTTKSANRGTGMLVGAMVGGVVGAMFGAMVGFGPKESVTVLKHCLITWNGAVIELPELQVSEAVLLRFLLSAAYSSQSNQTAD